MFAATSELWIKQLEPIDDARHIVRDYSIHDAIEAGFNHVVFIIHKDIDKELKESSVNYSVCACSKESSQYTFYYD